MSIRLPLQTVLSYNDSGNVGAGSALGVVAKTFTIPQDSDNVVVKMTASLVGATVSATLQTTDDGGTTWYDVARTGTVGVANNTVAQWLSAPVVGMGIRSTTFASSILGSTSAAAASTLGVNTVSGLPIMSQLGRVALIYTGNITTNDGVTVQVKVNSQSATA